MSSIRKVYDSLERKVLIMMGIPIPLFAVAYLSSQSGTLVFDLPEVPAFWESFGLGLVASILALHFVNFQVALKTIQKMEHDLTVMVDRYASATMQRFWILLFSGIACTAGLLFFDNAGFTILFAVTLVFCSLGKPTPDRIIRLLKLKGTDREEIEALKRRG